MPVQAQNGAFSVRAYRGDAKTLLAFDMPEEAAVGLAGFTIGFTANGQSHYLNNMLRFETPSPESQNPHFAPWSSVNAPLHKFRWMHVPGTAVLGGTPFYGVYAYTVTPRYFDETGLKPLDEALSAAFEIEVAPFVKGSLKVSFTRGYTQSEAFVHEFGEDAVFRPEGDDLIFDTSAVAGTVGGTPYTFEQEYAWLGFTARATILGLLEEVENDPTLRLDVFAYDLDEPDIVAAIIALAGQGRIRLILDNSALHHDTSDGGPLPEDEVEALFMAVQLAPAEIRRGRFARYSHDKVMVVLRADATGAWIPFKVLTGSTNFSVTGLYVNSNHVLLYDDPTVAATYERVFQNSWVSGVNAAAFRLTAEANNSTTFESDTVPKTVITFSPHSPALASQVLDGLNARILEEGAKPDGSVLFAVMGIDDGGGNVYPTLRALHTNGDIFTYGISDSPGSISLYVPGRRTGVLVVGKPGTTLLPPPFDQVPVSSAHQVHHKFVVCGFNGPDPVVYCGSSNLALGGEGANGDNLIAIYDADVVAAFAIEALALVDHFEFLDSHKAAGAPPGPPAPWFLSTDDSWARPYFDPDDLRCLDRLLFG